MVCRWVEAVRKRLLGVGAELLTSQGNDAQKTMGIMPSYYIRRVFWVRLFTSRFG
jgi:hypothetical protein